MAKNKTIIWLIGSNASGKTTQSKLLHQHFKTKDIEHHKWIEDGDNVKFTTFGRIGHVGLVGDNQCTGTDTLNSKKSIDMSLAYCLYNCDIVILDGIMATGQWSEIINQYDIAKTIVILLQFDKLEDNLRRVAERRVYKKIDEGGNDGADIADFEFLVDYELDDFKEKTIKNISSKFKGFKSMYERVKNDCNYSVEISANLTQDEIHVKILQELNKLIN